MPPLPRLLLLLPALLALSSRAAEDDRLLLMVSVDGLAHFYLDDPKAEMPNIRRLAAEGARAEKMMTSMPTVTWPNHTTLVTGVTPAKHGVLGNAVLDREKGALIPLVVDPIYNKDELVRAPTVYDVAKQAGLKTAALVWPATRGARTLDWTMPDVGTLELTKQFGTPTLLEEFTAAGIPWEMQHVWWKEEKGQDRDRMFVRQLSHVLHKHRPHLALLHLVDLDHIQHLKGPQSPEAYAAVKFEDELVGEVWEDMQRTHPGRATLFVVSDHGFLPYEQQILPNVLLRKEGLLTTVGSRITGGRVRAVAQGGACFLYVLDGPDREALTTRVAELFRHPEGVDQVIPRAEFPLHGLPDPAAQPQMADLVLSARSGYSFVDMAAGEDVVKAKTGVVKGSHGHDARHPAMHAMFVACGAAIKPGAKLGTIANTSVATTIAAILGTRIEGADGPVLHEILAQPPEKNAK